MEDSSLGLPCGGDVELSQRDEEVRLDDQLGQIPSKRPGKWASSPSPSHHRREYTPSHTPRHYRPSVGMHGSAHHTSPSSSSTREPHRLPDDLTHQVDLEEEAHVGYMWNPTKTHRRLGGANFAMSVEVSVPLKGYTFTNTLLIATVLLGMLVVARGILSIVASTSDADINMKHLLIADTVVFIFGVFMLVSWVTFFYVQDYMQSTFRHKLAVLMPYLAAVVVYTVAFIATWTFTQDYGAHLDRKDFVEVGKYNTAHVLHVVAAMFVFLTIPDAIVAHMHPEGETPSKYLVVPVQGTY